MMRRELVLQQLKKDGDNFKDIKFKRANRVHSLLAVNSHIKVQDTTVAVYPMLLF